MKVRDKKILRSFENLGILKKYSFAANPSNEHRQRSTVTRLSWTWYLDEITRTPEGTARHLHATIA